MNEIDSRRRQLNEFPVVGRLFRQFDEAVGERGLQMAMVELVKRAGAKLEVRGRERVEEVLTKEPVVLVANHPFDAEAILLIATLPPREDIYLIGSLFFAGIGPNFGKHLIPVNIEHHLLDEQKLLTRMGRKFRPSPQLNIKEAFELNRKAINIACEKINKGGLVILFPEGAVGDENKWYSGIGHLLSKLGEDSNAHMVNVHVGGTSNLDVVRLAPGVRRLLPSLKVTFANSQNVGDLVGDKSYPKRLTKRLQTEYNMWVKSLP